MKVVFIENRYKTWFWEKLAESLSSYIEGLEVAWIVQNPMFKPKSGKVFIIPFPKHSDLRAAANELGNIRISQADRNINYFGGDDRHYEYYRTEIAKFLTAEKPNVVIGESTLFHELLAIEWCEKFGIRYLQPIMIGYPGGRYTIYKGDTKSHVVQHGCVPSDDVCKAILDSICTGKLIPDYMKKITSGDPDRHYPLPGSVRDKLNVMLGYLKGDKYNTPSPWIKIKLDRRLRSNLSRWNDVAGTRIANSEKLTILYPMQLQPESNLDVWGQKYRDQTRLIKEIAKMLPENWQLLVKLNPKVKYELSQDLLDVVDCGKNIIPISSDTKMSDIFPSVDLVCTVTGTISVECVLSGKPLVCLGPSITEGFTGCVKLESLSCLAVVLADVEAGVFKVSDHAERIALIKLLFDSTFSGKISDPGTRPEVMQKDNLDEVSKNIASILMEKV